MVDYLANADFVDAWREAPDGARGRQRSPDHHKFVAQAVRSGQWTGMFVLFFTFLF